jgi:hypothetical protein
MIHVQVITSGSIPGDAGIRNEATKPVFIAATSNTQKELRDITDMAMKASWQQCVPAVLPNLVQSGI